MAEKTQLNFFDDLLKRDDPIDELSALLIENLNFHDESNTYASHNFHSFPAKFPPQLPAKFIKALTKQGDIVLDPMMGSGTTILEARLAGRNSVGFDIDPLSVMISKVKTSHLDKSELSIYGDSLVSEAELLVKFQRNLIVNNLNQRWDIKTKQFVDYWFSQETQIELQALFDQIEKIDDKSIKMFFLVTFSSIIITKSGGVSLALDLGHTRPHRAKSVIDKYGNIIINDIGSTKKQHYNSKTLSSPLDEFRKKLKKNIDAIPNYPDKDSFSILSSANAQYLPLHDNTIDLIVTSPPYVSNAIDYMRAHKFSLVWLGYQSSELGEKRKEYIGAETIDVNSFESLPDMVMNIVNRIGSIDTTKGKVVRRYFSEMHRTLRELYRVLKPGKAAIIVVGTSVIRGIDTQTGVCISEIGSALGFQISGIGIRDIDRNRRMMPIGRNIDTNSPIQNRMHKENILGLVKPDR